MTAEMATGEEMRHEQLLQSLLYSVSHDLRSPLLTMSLSADLLDDAFAKSGPEVAQPGSVSVALNALRQGAADMERMLQALTLLSRAGRKQLQPSRAPLSLVLGGHVVVSDEDGLGSRIVRVDPLAVREALDGLAPTAESLEIHVRITAGYAELEVAAPTEIEAATSPVEALVGSLQRCAGTVVERLAVGQILIERQGGQVRSARGRVTFALPLEGDQR